MLTSSDKEYLETKEIKLGNKKMKGEFLSLANWIDKTYGVKTIHIIYDNFYENKPRLQICFEYEYEMDQFLNRKIFSYNLRKQKAIAKKFKEFMELQGLAISDNSLDHSKSGYLVENVFVIYGAFEPIAKQETTSKIGQKELDDFMKSLDNPTIWKVSILFAVPTFFMFTNQQVKENDRSELQRVWVQCFFDFIKPYDEFNYFRKETLRVYLDSKENFDDNYQSNWYYYYK